MDLKKILVQEVIMKYQFLSVENEKNEFDSEDFYSDMGEEDIINVFYGN